MTVAPDRSSALVGVYGTLNRPTPEPQRVRLRGIDAEREYRVTAWPDDPATPWSTANLGLRVGADLLANGLVLDRTRHEAAQLGDFWSRLFVLEAV